MFSHGTVRTFAIHPVLSWPLENTAAFHQLSAMATRLPVLQDDLWFVLCFLQCFQWPLCGQEPRNLLVSLPHAHREAGGSSVPLSVLTLVTW